MNKSMINRFLIGFISVFLSSELLAEPIWRIEVLSGNNPRQVVQRNAVVNIDYEVQNNSRKSKNLVMQPMAGINQVTPCYLQPKGEAGNTCILTLRVIGNDLPESGIHGGPILCQADADGSPNLNQCHQPIANHALNITLAEPPPNTTLDLSLQTLALATNGILTDASGAGNSESKARKLIITNTGTVTAMDVNYSIAPALPEGTSISPTSCGNIAVGSTCELTVIPGNVPTSEDANTQSSPSVLTVQGSNTPSLVTSDILVLTYGNRYQGGFIFSFDDTTDETTSVGGKVASLIDQTNLLHLGTHWSSDIMDNPVEDIVPGIGEQSTRSVPSPALPSPNPARFVGCNGAVDGSCNTGNLFRYYPSNPTYAAGLCGLIISEFNDWYLPSICEMGFDTTSSGSGCGNQSAPTLQNMMSNLVPNLEVQELSGDYWSSTESSNSPLKEAWVQSFVTGSGFQRTTQKSFSHAVRCVRTF